MNSDFFFECKFRWAGAEATGVAGCDWRGSPTSLSMATGSATGTAAPTLARGISKAAIAWAVFTLLDMARVDVTSSSVVSSDGRLAQNRVDSLQCGASLSAIPPRAMHPAIFALSVHMWPWNELCTKCNRKKRFSDAGEVLREAF